MQAGPALFERARAVKRGNALEGPIVARAVFLCAHPRFGVEWGLYRSRGFVNSLAGSYHTALLYPCSPRAQKNYKSPGLLNALQATQQL